MNVRELIEELSKLDPELPAYYEDADYGLIEVELVTPRWARDLTGSARLINASTPESLRKDVQPIALIG